MGDNHDNNDYIWLYNHNRLVSDIKDFMDREFIYGITPEELFDLNKELIFQQYTDKDKQIEKDSTGIWPSSANDLTIKSHLPSPCRLKINPSRVTAEVAINQTNLQSNTSDFYAFADEKIQDIFQNDGYVIDNASKRNVDCRVFGWFKSLYCLGLDKDGKVGQSGKDISEFSDLSKYVISLATTVTENGGSFVIRLPIISTTEPTTHEITTKNGDFATWFGTAQKNKYDFGENDEQFFAKSSFDSVNANYFNWLISSNDLIFISFEKLEMEIKRGDTFSGESDSFDIKTAISDGIYDMIGLVDDVRVVSDSSSSSAYVEVSGRDLMKLLIEDGSFFFNPSTTSDPSAVFANDQSYGKQGDIREADVLHNTYNNPINRLRRITGEIDVFANRINMDISYILKGVISQLANVEIVPSYVFDSWGDERTKFIELEPDNEK